MFAGCTNLIKLDLRNWNVANAKNFYGMFRGCSELTTIFANDWTAIVLDTEKLNSSDMFKGCVKLVGAVSYDASKILFNMATHVTGYFYYETEHTWVQQETQESSCTAEGYVKSKCECGEEKTEPIGKKDHDYKDTVVAPTRDTQGYTEHNCDCGDSYKDTYTEVLNSCFTMVKGTAFNSLISDNITKIVFTNIAAPEDAVIVDVSANTDGSVVTWTEDTVMYVTTIDGGVLYANADCDEMCYQKANLKEIVFDNFNTSNVSYMSRMFRECTSLTELYFSSFDTSNTYTMGYMFKGCTNLITLDLSSWDLGKVTLISEIFNGCSALKTVYAGDWTNSATSAFLPQGMFRGCVSIQGAVAFDATKTGGSMANPTTGYFSIKAE